MAQIATPYAAMQDGGEHEHAAAQAAGPGGAAGVARQASTVAMIVSSKPASATM